MFNRDFFEKKIKPLLLYIGSIGAVLMCIAYVLVVMVLIFGFKVKNIEQSILFAVVNAIVGFIIMQFLKIQGIDFAKALPENKEVLDYFNARKPKKRNHTIGFYWFKSITSDLLIKCLTIAVTTCGLIYLVIEGSQDYNLLLLAAVNLIMFICFGMVSLSNAYDYYNDNHIPYLKDKIKMEEIKTHDNNEQQCCIAQPGRTSTEE
jgi:hypothetical protein